jgi:hypothetical protein
MNPRGVTVRHREYIADVAIPSGTPTFNSGSYGINPGMPALFPWLSTMANSYELYRFNRLCFEYVTRSPATTGGSVYLAVDYDACDIPPVDKQGMLSYEGAVSDAAWQNIEVHLPSAFLNLGMRERYTRAGEYADVDKKTYDTGTLIIATEAIQELSADVHIGELWVDYEVELLVPQIRQANRAAGISINYGSEPVSLLAGEGIFVSSSGPLVMTGAIPGTLASDGKVFTFSRPWQGIVRQTITKTTSAIRKLSGGATFVDSLLDFGESVANLILTVPTVGAGSTNDVIETYLKVGLGDIYQFFVSADTGVTAAAVAFLTGAYGINTLPELERADIPVEELDRLEGRSWAPVPAPIAAPADVVVARSPYGGPARKPAPRRTLRGL